MNENLQSAGPMDQVHPDADQLTAFAEQALPLHERQETLAHLAGCAGCREIVFLAQQAAEDEAVAAVPVQVRRPWFAGWNLVWPALIAVAGMVAFSVHLMNAVGNVAKPMVAVGGSTTEAAVVEPQPPAPTAPPVVPAAPKPLGIAPLKAKVAPAPMIAGKLGAVPVDAGANVAGAAEEPKSVTLADARPAVATSRMLGGIGGSGSAGAPVAMTAPAAAKRNAARSGPAAQQMPQMQNANGTGMDQAASTGYVVQQPRLRAIAPAFSAGAAASAPAAAPAPPPAPAPKPATVTAAPPVGSANETVSVAATSATSQVTLDTLSSDAMVMESRPVKLPVLPSHLAAASSARYGAVWLALDSAGGLFRSNDAAKHWKRVKPQWDGQAAKVGVTASGGGLPFELTTAAGAVWTSADGQHWKRR
jgi:hypothetical protein